MIRNVCKCKAANIPTVGTSKRFWTVIPPIVLKIEIRHKNKLKNIPEVKESNKVNIPPIKLSPRIRDIINIRVEIINKIAVIAAGVVVKAESVIVVLIESFIYIDEPISNPHIKSEFSKTVLLFSIIADLILNNDIGFILPRLTFRLNFFIFSTSLLLF